MPQYSIVIAQLPTDKVGGAAEALGKVLGIGAASAEPVLRTLPTVLFDGLEYQQARRVMALLTDVSGRGAVLLLAEGDGGSLARVKWPGEPVVSGKPLSAYRSPGGGTRCPVCGSLLRSDVYLQEETGTSSEVLPLPDLPRLPREGPQTPSASGRHAGGALNITDVEKVWKERASKSGIQEAIKKPVQKPTPDSASGSGSRKSPSAVLNAVDREVPTLEPSPSGQYDVFVGRTSSPGLPALIADVRGVSADEARRIAKKTIIPVAKGVGQEKALEVKRILEGMKLKPKVVPRRKSSGELPRDANI